MVKIFGLEIGRSREEDKVMTFSSGKSPWKEGRIIEFTEEALEQPQESTAEGEVEETGIPNYDAIDTLALYDPIIDGATNIFTSTLLATVYKIKHEDDNNNLELWQKLEFIDFDTVLAKFASDFYKYGNAFVNIVITGGDVTQLQIIPPHYIKKAIKTKKFYEYDKGAGETEEIVLRDILHFKMRNIKDYAYGESIFTPALELIEDWARMNEQFRIHIEQYVSPILHGTVGGEDLQLRPSPDALLSVAEDMENSKKAGTDLVTDAFVKFTYLSPDRGMAIQPFLDFFRHKLLMATMIPETFTMIRSEAAAGGDAANQVVAFNNWIRFIQKYFLEPIINNHLIPMLMGTDVYNEEGEKEELNYEDFPRIEFNPTIDWKMKHLNYYLKQWNISMIDDEIRDALGLAPFSDEQRKIMLETQQSGQNQPSLSDGEGDGESSKVRIDKEKGE